MQKKEVYGYTYIQPDTTRRILQIKASEHDSGYLSNFVQVPYEETHFAEAMDDIIVSKEY